MNPKTLQYLMGHSDISVTMNVYTHIGFDDAEEELKRMEDLQNARKELEQTRGGRSWCRKGCLRQYDYRKNERRFAVAGRFLYRESCINMVQ